MHSIIAALLSDSLWEGDTHLEPMRLKAEGVSEPTPGKRHWAPVVRVEGATAKQRVESRNSKLLLGGGAGL